MTRSSFPPETVSDTPSEPAKLGKLEKEIAELKRFQECLMNINRTLLASFKTSRPDIFKLCLSLLIIVDNIIELERAYEKNKLSVEEKIQAKAYLAEAITTIEIFPCLDNDLLPLKHLAQKMQKTLFPPNLC